MAPASNRILFWVHIKVVVSSASQQTFMSRVTNGLIAQQTPMLSSDCHLQHLFFCLCVYFLQQKPHCAFKLENEAKVVMQMVNWKLKKWSWRKLGSCFHCSEAKIWLTSLKAAFQNCFIWYRGSQKLESFRVSWETWEIFNGRSKEGHVSHPKGLGPQPGEEKRCSKTMGRNRGSHR